ncbi:alpha-glucosidase/alpha-galactosidase [Clostridia bacterium]|nr:alpha-glucosidase/alpha-galactosidase [Clostridia bacterium]
MFKIAFIGAGSLVFTSNLLSDLLAVPEFRAIEVAFTDVDQTNLDLATKICQRDIDANKLKIKIQSTLDRREALKGAKYIINCAKIGGLEANATDVEIPMKYGVDQCVGDTLCAGGIMYGQRGIPAALEFCKDIQEVAAPDALFLNYANPNAMITWACNRYGGVKTLGLCHGVQNGHQQIAKALGYEAKDIDIICAGINHQTWYISVKYKGEDMLSRILPAYENDPYLARTEKVRIDILKRTGYYSTETNGHLSEYLAWYRKRPDELKNWIDLEIWYGGESGGHLRVNREMRDAFNNDFDTFYKADPKNYDTHKRTLEHGSYIIEGLELGHLYRGHFNVVNNGAIANLSQDAIVEVPAYVDGNGISIPKVGDLPLVCAAICQQSINVQRLAVEAAVRGDEMLLKQAMMMDPLVGAVCTPPEIWAMTDEMLVAGEKWLPQYKAAIAGAKKRIKEAAKTAKAK